MTDIEMLTSAYRECPYSDDPATQNGSVLKCKDGYVYRGRNRLPVGNAQTKPERLIRPLKHKWMEHAERDVIYRAAYWGSPTKGATLYCCWAACVDCARAIICSGIERVVGHDSPVRRQRVASGESIAVAY